LRISLQRPDDTDPAHGDRLLADGDRAAAHIGIARRHRANDLRQRQAMRDHPIEIDFGLKFLGPAAQDQHVGHAWNDAQPALNHPVLQRLEMHDIDFGGALDTAGRRDHRLHPGRKNGVLEPVDGLLPDKVVVAAVFELDPDEAQRINRVGADEPQPRRAGDGYFERDRDVTFHLLGRLARVLGDDFDDGRRRILVGLDVQRGKRGIAHRKECGEAGQHQRAA